MHTLYHGPIQAFELELDGDDGTGVDDHGHSTHEDGDDWSVVHYSVLGAARLDGISSEVAADPVFQAAFIDGVATEAVVPANSVTIIAVTNGDGVTGSGDSNRRLRQQAADTDAPVIQYRIDTSDEEYASEVAQKLADVFDGDRVDERLRSAK